MMKSKIQPSPCPLCKEIPIVNQKYFNPNFSNCEYNCFCKKCRTTELENLKSNKEIDKYLERFGWGACSQSSKQAAIRQWNAMVQRYYIRQIKDAVKPQKMLKPLKEVLEAAKYPASSIRYILKAERAYTTLRALVDTHGLGTDFLKQLDNEFPDAECCQ